MWSQETFYFLLHKIILYLTSCLKYNSWEFINNWLVGLPGFSEELLTSVINPCCSCGQVLIWEATDLEINFHNLESALRSSAAHSVNHHLLSVLTVLTYVQDPPFPLSSATDLWSSLPFSPLGRTLRRSPES